MPDLDIEINPSLSRRAFEAAEPALKSAIAKGGVAGRIAEGLNSVAHNFGRADTWLTGDSGKAYRGMWTDYTRNVENHAKIITDEHKAKGIATTRERIYNEAARRARVGVYDHNDANAVALIKMVNEEHGPMKAARVANRLQIDLQDRQYAVKKFRTSPTGQVTSKLDPTEKTAQLYRNVRKDPALAKLSEQLFPLPAAEGPEAAKYLGPLYRGTQYYLAPFTAVKHLDQFAGLVSNTRSLSTAWNIFQSSFGTGRDNIINIMNMNDAGAEFFTDAEADIHRYKNGMAGKLLSPWAGQVISKYGGGAPGMRFVRERLVPMAAAKGHFGATEAIENLIKDPKSRTDQVNLAYLGLKDWEAVAQRYMENNRSLHPDDSRIAIDTAIEQYAFTRNPMFRSTISQTPMGRFLTTYHWVAQAQKSFIQREIMHALNTRNPIQVATTLGTLGLLYGGTYMGIHKVIGMIRGTREPDDTPEGHAKMWMNNMNVLTGIAGWGTEWSYINGAVHGFLADDLLGADIGNWVSQTEDLAKGVYGKAIGRKHAMYPFARDVIHDATYGVGDRLAHKIFPSRADVQADRPMTYRRKMAQKAARHRQERAKYKED